jgi:hypothetical protein
MNKGSKASRRQDVTRHSWNALGMHVRDSRYTKSQQRAMHTNKRIFLNIKTLHKDAKDRGVEGEEWLNEAGTYSDSGSLAGESEGDTER